MIISKSGSLPCAAQAGAAGTTDENDEVPSRKDVSVAYCSLAEIYLTDLWYRSRTTCTADNQKYSLTF